MISTTPRQGEKKHAKPTLVSTPRSRRPSNLPTAAHGHRCRLFKQHTNPLPSPPSTQSKAREAEVERLNARTIEDDMAEASLEELDELEDELADDGMLEKYR